MALKHKVLKKKTPIKGASFFDQDTSLSAWPGHYQVAVGSGEPRRFDGIDILVGKVMTAEASEFREDFGLQIDWDNQVPVDMVNIAWFTGF